jgi:hypothetical protein
MDDFREVYDGWYYWRAIVVPFPSPILRRYGCRFVRERKFASTFPWEQVSTSRWFASFSDCEKAANTWLDGKWFEGRLVR